MIADSASLEVAALEDVANDDNCRENEGNGQAPHGKSHNHRRNGDVLEVEHEGADQSKSRNYGNDDGQTGNNC